jgi:hypothetical protein
METDARAGAIVGAYETASIGAASIDSKGDDRKT